MRGVVLALVGTTVLAMLLLVLGSALGAAALSRAGLVVLLLVPVVRNVVFVAVERRAWPRALAIAVGLALLAIYAWFLLGGG